MLVSVASAKAAPGASTLAALLAAMWPGDVARRVVLEADADGGVLAARWRAGWGTTWQPGVAEFAAQARTGIDTVLDDVAQDIGGGVGLLACLPDRRAATAVGALNDELAARLAGSDALVVADVGRARRETRGLWRRSQAVLLVTAAGIEGVQATGPLRAELSDAGARCGLVVVGDSGHELVEYGEVVGVDPGWVWQVPVDPRAARVVDEAGPASQKVKRSRLGRAVAQLAADLDHLTTTAAGTTDPEPGVALWATAGEADVSSTSFREVTSRG